MGLYADMARRLQAGETVAMATVVGARGSTPREVGAKMLVCADGQQQGTVGGGCGEAAVWRAALDVVRDGAGRRVQVDLLDDPGLEAEAVCGGIMDVFVAAWTPGDAPLAAAVEGERPVAVATVVQGSGGVATGARLVAGPEGVGGDLAAGPLRDWALTQALGALADGHPRLVRHGDVSLFVDVVAPAPWLVIAGAGHIGRALCAMGALAGFRVAVLDDRPEYADRRHFPAADLVVARDFAAGLRELPLGNNAYVVIVTRGHRHDYFVLSDAIHKPVAYLGMIGSRRRVGAVFQLLRDAGVPEELTRRVHAPIGVDIGAMTPAEIAIAILAEITAVRRGVRTAFLKDTRGARPARSLR